MVVDGTRTWVPESWKDANGQTYYFPLMIMAGMLACQYISLRNFRTVLTHLPQELTIEHLTALSTGEITVFGLPLWNSNVNIFDRILGGAVDSNDLTLRN